MKSTVIAICAAFLISCNNEVKNADSTTNDSTSTASTDTSSTNQEPGNQAWVPVDSATAMKTMMEVGTPGPEHQMLAKSNGNWKAEITMWEGQDAAPMKVMGTVNNKMILGGRYQMSTVKADMGHGMALEGSSVVGYDKGRKMWVSTWIDNWSTGIINMEGRWDEATKSAVYTGKMLCPANGIMCEIKQVMKTVDDKTEIMEMYGPDMKTGKQYKNMEMKLTKG